MQTLAKVNHPRIKVGSAFQRGSGVRFQVNFALRTCQTLSHLSYSWAQSSTVTFLSSQRFHLSFGTSHSRLSPGGQRSHLYQGCQGYFARKEVLPPTTLQEAHTYHQPPGLDQIESMVCRHRICLVAHSDSESLSIYSTHTYQGVDIPIFENQSIARIVRAG